LDRDLCFSGWPDDNLVLERAELDKLSGQQDGMSGIRQARTQKQQAGFTLLELMITCLILTVGLLAIAGLFATAVGNNGRSRVDSTATMLAASVIEQVTAVLARGGPASVTDCGQPPTTWTIDTSVGGAALSNVAPFGPSIDFTQTNPPSGYQMNYVVCNGGGFAGTQAVYDVRWNIQQISTSPPSSSYLVTIAAEPRGMTNNRFTFALPVTFRTFVGPQ
jgi:prepilin-type N-terminal cleavage/methylation domain-containing protein